MTLSRKEIAAARDVYEIYWDSYFSGNSEEFGNTIDLQFTMIGTSESEVSFGKAEAIEILMAQYDEVVGKAERRNRQVKEIPTGDMLQIIEFCDIYVLIDSDWSFYSKFRLSTLLHQTPDGWKLLQQHGSLPDMRVEEGETVAVEKISKENLELRDAIKRRTIELENKSRELEIEAALERVRGRSMAMQNSDELKAVIKVVYEQLSNLNINLDHAGFVVDYSPQDDWHFWIADDREIPSKITHPYFESVWANQFNEAKKNGATHFVTHLNFEEKNKFYHELLSHVSGLTETSKDFYLSCPGLAATTALFDDFSLYIENFSGIPYKEEENEIVLRFGKVFQQAYTRFLDLQKAEAQAREAQIETALEKVRSRTMAMQHSDELQEASYLLDQQVRSLGIQTWGCAFNIYGDEDSTEWFGNEAGVLHTYTVPRKGIFKEYYEKGQRGESIIINEFSGKACVDHYEYMSKLPVLGDVLKILKETNDGFPTYQIDHVVYFKYGYLLFITREDVPEAHGIFKRFAKVFEQTYTRFLDLQKAEAQAREAQIEASLERVRSRSMAMQKTEELTDSGALLYQELSKLGIQNLSTGYTFFDETATMGWSYGVNPSDGSIRHKPVGMDHTKTKVMKAIAASWKKQEPLLVLQLNEQETIKHQTFIADECIDFPISKEQLLAISPKQLVVHTFNFKQGYLLIVGGELLTEAQQHMISRFAKVFQQTYTRFLDLQKSEAQAREAKIEAALEKVRSRSLAMHQSQELNEVVMVLFEKLKDLQIPSTAVAIQTFRENSKDMQVFVCGDVGTGLVINYYLLPYFNHRIINDYHAARKDRSDFYIGNYSKKEKDSFYDYVLKLPELKDLPSEVEQMIRQSTHYSITMVPAEKSLIAVNDFEGKVLAESEVGIIKRFAKVFDQAYTRFLDLQKAEAQAREAQIEASLERIRAKSMAMHHSDELDEVLAVLCEQFDTLGIFPMSTHMTVLDIANNKFTFRETGKFGNRSFGEQTVALDAMDTWNDMVESWKSADPYSINTLYFPKETLPQVWEVFHESFASMPEDSKITPEDYPDGIFHTAGKHPFGYIGMNQIRKATEEEEQIVIKFANEFGRAYTRFLDLQKAEAQARKARVQTALERVRSRSMAMHQSSEIGEVAFVLFQQLKNLGGEFWGTGFGFCKQGSGEDEFWFANENGIMPHLKIPNTDDPVHRQMYRGWQNNLELFSIAKDGKELEDHYKYMLKVPDVQPIFQGMLENGITFPKWQKWHAAYFKYGYLLAITTEAYDNGEILVQFAKVFEQAYLRFLDLQKAEAQAREARIEAALEHTRTQSMLMQHSDEIKNISEIFHQQLLTLNIPTEFSYVWLPDESKNNHQFWASWAEEVKGGLNFISKQVTYPLDKTEPYTAACYQAWSKPERVHEEFIPPSDISDFFGTWAELLEGAKNLKANNFKEGIYYSEAYMRYGCFGINIRRDLSVEEKGVLKRFSTEFERAYTRFLDLQKAEAQAREAKIENALEKVRSRSLAMHKSDELTDVVSVLFEQLKDLQIPFTAVGIATGIQGSKDLNAFVCGQNETGLVITNYRLPYFDNPIPRDLYNSLDQQSDFFVGQYSKKEKDDFYEYVIEHTAEFRHLPADIKKMIFGSPTYSISMVAVRNAVFNINDFEGKVLADTEIDIIKRFARGFDQAYTRFLDLQKAETQAREAKIETALEKVRSRTMGMQKSDELADVADVLFKEMNNLVHNLWTCGFVLCEKDREEDEWWLGLEEGFTRGFFLPNVNDYAHAHLYEGWLKKDDFRTVQLEGDDLQAHYEWLMEIPVAKNIFDEMEAAGMERPEWQKLHAAYFSKGYLVIITREPCPEEAIFKRFAQVFDLTYTRFLDLHKAEAQAREAQIENALEKVRSRSLAMQNPDELIEVAELLREEMGALGVEELETSSIYIHDDSTNLTQCWFTIKDADDQDKSVTDQMTINLQDTWVGQEMFDFYRSGAKQTSVKMAGDRRIEWIRYCGEKSNLFTPDSFYGDSIPERTYHLYKFSNGYIGAASPGEISDESWDLLRRATSVFSFAYTRFLDLKKAKEQTREAQIELSLERIRARVTGMQESSDLLDIVVTMRTEFVNLGHEAHYFWHMRWLPDTYKKAMTSGDGTKIGMVMTLPRHIHGDIEEVAAWEKTKEPIHVLAMDVDVAVDYVDKMITLGDFERVDPQAPTLDDIRHIGGLTFVMARTTHGEIGFSLPGVVPDPPKDAVDTLVRFAGVFDLAYRRFEDLKKAEAQARENQIELALEKVRSRTMTMERSSELADTSVVVFKELLNLGIAPNRLFIGIIKDNGNAVEAWATNEDGSKIENQFQLYPSENKSIQKMVNAWKQEKKSTVIDMSGKELKDYFHYLNKVMRIPFIDGLQQKRRVQTIAYFSGGLIGMAAPEEQPQETTELLERFAAVFNLTYTRFNDLKIAEKQALQAEKDLIEIKQARQKAEDALIELKATQTQLVQQEKLASLGQLTAGIAHEIKNPLNFVNNFSEVSVELIDDAFEELEKLDDSDAKEEIIAILTDVKSNLTKVHEHGSRADSIVKSMLQHSRGGNGKIEPTDLNALITEYTNLAFHGMRASKNAINVEIDLQLDQSITDVPLISEDFSRVILNLCNNAFDAMRETEPQRSPKLTVRTHKSDNHIFIELEDNGPGIADMIKDKVLQPFFTTKKGTEGTGLGLSITNDIIKAHGGKLEIQSQPGRTVFQIYFTL